MTIRVGMLILHPNIQFTMKMFLRMICDVFALLQKVAVTITANSTCLLVRKNKFILFGQTTKQV